MIDFMDNSGAPGRMKLGTAMLLLELYDFILGEAGMDGGLSG